MRPKSVVMCVCHRRTFKELQEIAMDRHLTTLDELTDQDYCGNGCTMCHPYVIKMLVTGETAFAPGEWYIKES